MSQYGANVMAQSGANYEEILTHYYQGAVLAGCARRQCGGVSPLTRRDFALDS